MSKVAGTKALIKKLEKIKADLSKSRDALRELQDEVETQLSDKDTEICDLESVIDSLSKYV